MRPRYRLTEQDVQLLGEMCVSMWRREEYTCELRGGEMRVQAAAQAFRQHGPSRALRILRFLDPDGTGRGKKRRHEQVSLYLRSRLAGASPEAALSRVCEEYRERPHGFIEHLRKYRLDRAAFARRMVYVEKRDGVSRRSQIVFARSDIALLTPLPPIGGVWRRTRMRPYSWHDDIAHAPTIGEKTVMVMQMTVEPDALLRPEDAARFLGFSLSALEAWRRRGGGPTFVRVSSRAVRYRKRDLVAWTAERLSRGSRASSVA